MIQKDIHKFKGISILLIFLLSSCSIQKDSKHKTNIMSMVITDYILEFSEINGKRPSAILIRKEEHVISINDLPMGTSMGYLRKSVRKEENLGAGNFSNVLCIYYFNEIGEDNIIFKDVPLKLQRKSEQTNKITISGKELSIPYTEGEWEPSLVIKYDLNSKKKYIDDCINRIERTADFP